VLSTTAMHCIPARMLKYYAWVHKALTAGRSNARGALSSSSNMAVSNSSLWRRLATTRSRMNSSYISRHSVSWTASRVLLPALYFRMNMRLVRVNMNGSNATKMLDLNQPKVMAYTQAQKRSAVQDPVQVDMHHVNRTGSAAHLPSHDNDGRRKRV